jgi:hypothetical protein
MADTAVNTPQSDNLNAVTSLGVVITANRSGPARGVLLPGPGTYLFAVGGERSDIPAGCGVVGVHIAWSATVAGTFTLDATNFPTRERAATAGPIDVSDFDMAVGRWLQWNSTASYIPIVGAGNTVVATTITAGGTNAGAALLEISQLCARRVRIKAVITAAGANAVVRVAAHGKAL